MTRYLWFINLYLVRLEGKRIYYLWFSTNKHSHFNTRGVRYWMLIKTKLPYSDEIIWVPSKEDFFTGAEGTSFLKYSSAVMWKTSKYFNLIVRGHNDV